MPTPCGIFWDIQSIPIPEKSSAEAVFSLIKRELVDLQDLTIEDFYVVGGHNIIGSETVNGLKSLGADFEEVEPEGNTAHEKIKDRMLQFINRFNQKCSIVSITGDNGIGESLKEFGIERPLRSEIQDPRFKIYLISLEHLLGGQLEQIANTTFLLRSDSRDQVYLEKLRYIILYNRRLVRTRFPNGDDDDLNEIGELFMQYQRKIYIN